MIKKLLFVSSLLLVGLILAACGGSATPVAATPCPDCPTCPTPEVCPVPPTPFDTSVVPNYAAWMASAHADAKAVAFTHWDAADPKEVPVTCAKCHSETGFQDYVGADGSAVGVVDKAAATGTVITCNTCHNAGTANYSTVKFPSGAELSGLGREAVCMTCHQGAASMVQVDESITKSGATDEDAVVKDLGFTNIHYFAASVARFGTLVKGGYEYPGKAYDAMFDHVKGMDSCTDCHDPHSLKLKVDKCATCHTGVKTVEDVKNIRMFSSLVDYDGDGDVKEGIASELDGLRAMLYTAMQAYAKDVAGSPLVYSAAAYPYFFIDTNGDGAITDDEAVFANAYITWTPRLAKAAYNYQASIKDPGAFAHGGKYIIELLYDSIDSLNQKLATPVDLSKAHRVDSGHFDGSAQAFRHWDAAGKVDAGCVKCHTGTGLGQLIAEGVNTSAKPGDGLLCQTCHDDLVNFTRVKMETIAFPNGAKLSFEGAPDANLCLNCHQGRESTVSVNKAVAGKDPDKVVEKLGFRNVHYFAAGATLFGSAAQGMYEYKGKEYAGQFPHTKGFNTCTDCHDAHALTVKTDACKGCHGVDDPGLIRMNSKDDYNGNGDTTEGLKGELAGLSDQLYAAIQAYAKDKVKMPIVYSAAAYPYFFNDTNGDGVGSADELVATNAYASWTPRLLEAAYNYQYYQKDPGAFVHNFKYVAQVMFDAIKDLGATPKGVRP